MGYPGCDGHCVRARRADFAGKAGSGVTEDFLSALAILDDMGAVAIIAIFYTSHISLMMLGGAMVTALMMFMMNRAGLKRLFPYLVAGCLMWFFMLQSGFMLRWLVFWWPSSSR
jgi:Na+/H+ antiporter NhaA